MSAEDNSNLFELHNDLLLGNYQSVISTADSISPASDRQKVLIKTLVYRAMIAQGNALSVIDEADSSGDAELQACKLLAESVLHAERSDEAVSKCKALMKATANANSDAVRLLCATVYANAGDDESALRCVRGSSDLECLALGVQLYLKLSRPDLAEKELKAMQAVDDDHTATQLANAWLLIAAGGEKYEDAWAIFHDLAEKYASTPFLLNSMAVCHIHQAKWEQAEADLLDAMQKNNKNPDTLANMLVVAQHRGKPDEILKRYLSQLQQVAPQHAFCRSYAAALTSFDSNKNRFTI